VTQLPRPLLPPPREPLDRDGLDFERERDAFGPKLAPAEARFRSRVFEDFARLDFTEPIAPLALPTLCRESVPWMPVAAVTSPSVCPCAGSAARASINRVAARISGVSRVYLITGDSSGTGFRRSGAEP
jgi:hypothetical protein